VVTEVVFGAAAFGVLLGPALAALTVLVPAGRSTPDAGLPGLIRGRPAGPGRIAVVTALSAGVSAALGLRLGAGWELPAFLLLGVTGSALALIDVEHHRLPDRIVLPAYAVGVGLLLVAALATGDLGRWLRALAAMAVVFAAFFLLVWVNPDGFGFGDAKLGGLLALHLGWLGASYVLTGLVAGFVLGALAAVLLIVLRRATLRSPVAFGPALLAGALLAILTGGPPVTR